MPSPKPANEFADGGDGRNGAPFSYEGLERVLHEKARLGILTSLATHPDGLLFGDIKDLCALTDGNLSRHLQTLVDAGLIELWKRASGRRGQTLCRLTPHGLERFTAYLRTLERVIEDAATCREQLADTNSQQPQKPLPPGWQPA